MNFLNLRATRFSCNTNLGIDKEALLCVYKAMSRSW